MPLESEMNGGTYWLSPDKTEIEIRPEGTSNNIVVNNSATFITGPLSVNGVIGSNTTITSPNITQLSNQMSDALASIEKLNEMERRMMVQMYPRAVVIQTNDFQLGSTSGFVSTDGYVLLTWDDFVRYTSSLNNFDLDPDDLGNWYSKPVAIQPCNASGVVGGSITTVEFGNQPLTYFSCVNNPDMQYVTCNNTFVEVFRIHDCSNLLSITAQYNANLTNLNLYNCNALTTLLLAYNNLQYLDVYGMINLGTLDVSGNANLNVIASIETLITLNTINISGTQITGFSNPSSNYLTDFGCTDNTAITTIGLQDSNITACNVSGCSSLTSLTCNSCGGLGGMNINGCDSLDSVDIANCVFDATNLDDVYTQLPDRGALSTGTITVTNNPGVGSDDQSIATAKNWTVIDE